MNNYGLPCDHVPIGYQSYAPDYGVGGYLFQAVDGEKNHVAFVSTSVSKFNYVGQLYKMKFARARFITRAFT